MDRRKALRNMGLAMGYTVATPTLISIMQSCKSETVLEWTPDFFTKDQGAVLTKLIDIIIPQTDTPSAAEVQVNLFIDRFVNEVVEKEEQDFLKMTMDRFIDKALKDSGNEMPIDLTAKDLEKTLATALKVTKEERKTMFEEIETYKEALAKGETPKLDDKVSRFSFCNSLRDLTIWGYKTSEYVGEKVLEYRPLPGVYIPCGDVQELTGGKAWSL